MNQTEIIYLDIDGVLNQFPLAAIRRITGFKLKYPIPGNYDIRQACNKCLKVPLSPEQFWVQFDRKFWATIPPTPECGWLPELCSQVVGRKNVFLLTSPVEDPDSLAGKLEWIYSYLPSWIHRQFLITPHKWLCAKPNALLIDDYDANIDKFKLYGGQTMLVPRPWNSQFTKET